LLSGQFSLHGLDVEPFAARVVDRTLRRRNIEIYSVHRREDLLAFVIAEVWVASRKFDARRYASFEQFAYSVAQRRVFDWIRLDAGRSRWAFGPNADHAHAGGVYERERPELLSLDFERESGDGELDGALSGVANDFADTRSPDLMRVLAAGSGAGDRDDVAPSL